jgi:hypothetical protein
MAEHFKLTYDLFCSAEDAERLDTEAGDNLFCDRESHSGGFANPDHMTRVQEPCRHQISTFCPVREEDEVFLDLTAEEARLLAALMGSRAEPALQATADRWSTG